MILNIFILFDNVCFFNYIIIFKLNIVLYLIPKLFVISHRPLWFNPVSHRTRLGTRFQYGKLGYTRVDWYEYWVPTVPGDVLVRLRLECSNSMYEQSMDILDQARFVTVWKRFPYDCCRVPSMVCYCLVRLNTTFTRLTGRSQGLHTVSPTFVRVMLELSHIRVCFDIKLTRFDGLASQIFELSTEKV